MVDNKWNETAGDPFSTSQVSSLDGDWSPQETKNQFKRDWQCLLNHLEAFLNTDGHKTEHSAFMGLISLLKLSGCVWSSTTSPQGITGGQGASPMARIHITNQRNKESGITEWAAVHFFAAFTSVRVNTFLSSSQSWILMDFFFFSRTQHAWGAYGSHGDDQWRSFSH